ncbi:MAG: imelysin family protein [Alphaproteobacteria bacterium]
MGSRPRPVDPSFPRATRRGGGRKRRWLAIAAALLALVPQASFAAEVADAAYAPINRNLATAYAVPRFAALSKAASRMRAAAEALCRARSGAALATAKARFHDTMDAWMGVQHLGFGPAELFSRAHRIYFWPQARGKIAGAVDKLLAGGAIPPSARMTTASAAIQGLPALEHLLFDRTAILMRDDRAGKRDCALLLAVTANIQSIAKGLAEDWAGGRVDFKRVVSNPGPDNLYYKHHQEAALAFFQSFHDGLEAIVATRLRPLIGATPDADRPRLAESRASGRSTRNIVVSLQAIAALYTGDGKTKAGFSQLVRKRGDKKLDALMRRAFKLTIANARSIGKPLEAALRDKRLRPRVTKLLLQVRALKQIVRTRLAPAIGLAVGFNALDGD